MGGSEGPASGLRWRVERRRASHVRRRDIGRGKEPERRFGEDKAPGGTKGRRARSAKVSEAVQGGRDTLNPGSLMLSSGDAGPRTARVHEGEPSESDER